ncbi:MAG TPA: M20/M25/M40 family metallo-hydrolase [Gemmatimonadales bacterium]|nr:M20/M25/M40 family metallo-hydrolase [Gemmatimonadales bacterium]
MRIIAALLLSALVAAPVAAQQTETLDRVLLSTPDAAKAREYSTELSRVIHVAGSPRQVETADYVLRLMRSWGLDTSRVSYKVYLPWADSAVVELAGATPTRLALAEPPVPGDTTSYLPQYPTVHGYSGSGDVTAPLIYVNYGLPVDYTRLDSLGISVKGKIVIARYGRSFRGIKAREAESHGAAAILIYSDPQDDGFVPGDVYPEGPMRGPFGVQRGTVQNGDGDPSTPGWPSTPDAKRLDPSQMAIPHIPSVPLSYGNAQVLLQGLKGPSALKGWQGGLPFHYHLGGTDDVKARVAVWAETGARAWKTIINTFGTLKGTTWPDEMVVTGGHRDAWGPGTADNIAGVTSVLESARAWGEAAKRGLRPRRTLVFATWDAEEWGDEGSTEWVEAHEADLSAHAVGYFNQDAGGVGRFFGASATASLQPLVREVTRLVPQPGDTASIYDVWRRRAHVADSLEPAMGDLGGGSDFAAFYNHLGIPSADWGFGGASGNYHSQYDDEAWMEKWGDSGFLGHRAIAQIDALLLARMADRDVLPLDEANLAHYMGSLVKGVEVRAAAAGWHTDMSELRRAITGMYDAALGFANVRDAGMAASDQKGAIAALARANLYLRQSEMALARPDGLVGRPWFRNLMFAADRDNGYADIALPGIAEAMEDKDRPRFDHEVADLATRVDRAAELLRQATAALARR